MSNRKSIAIVSILSALLCIVSIGCGPKQPACTVNGTVTMDGKQLNQQTQIVITFVNEVTGRGNGAFLNPDGSYVVDRLEVGNYKIGIASDFSPDMGSEAPPAPKVRVPEKYSDPHASGLTCPVQEGANTFNIDLKK